MRLHRNPRRRTLIRPLICWLFHRNEPVHYHTVWAGIEDLTLAECGRCGYRWWV